jgi:hypothetical protein
LQARKRGTSTRSCCVLGEYKTLKPDPVGAGHKAVLDTLLLPVHGVEAGEMSGMPAYFINKRMFACICNGGVGIRLPAATAANLQFSASHVFPFTPKGVPATREWVQLNRDNSADYEKDKEILMASVEFVKNDRKR